MFIIHLRKKFFCTMRNRTQLRLATYVNNMVIEMNIYSLVIIEKSKSEKYIICHRFIL